MEHTKGEWTIERPANDGIMGRVIVGENGFVIATVNDKANAQLIASAPDCYKGLKDALKEICRMCVRLNPQHEDCKSCEEMERSRLPLLKVEGE